MVDVKKKFLDGGRGLSSLQPELSSGLASKVGSFYGLDETAVKQLSVLLNSGYSDEEIGKWISDTIGSRRDEQRNSLSSQIAEMRSNGVNPDLNDLGGSAGVASSPAFEPLPSEGGKGSLSSRVDNIMSSLLRLATFGVSAYSGLSGSLMKEGLVLAGYAGEDILSVLGDESGRIEDVNSFIADQVKARGLSGRKAKRYIREIGARVNSIPAITSRLENRSKLNNARFDSAMSATRVSDEFIQSSSQVLLDGLEAQKIAVSIDLKEKGMKLEFLEKHPEYTEESLNAELAQKKADASAAEARAANEQAQGTLLAEQVEGQRLSNENQRTQNDLTKSNSDVQILQNDLRELELQGIDMMLEYVERYESGYTKAREKGFGYEFKNSRWDTPGFTSERGYFGKDGKYHEYSRSRYKDYKSRIDEYYRRTGKTRKSLRLGYAGASVGASF